MNFYENYPVEFKELFELIANKLHKNVLMIEKDYIQSLFLYELSKKNINLVFKGGTSLSKAYKLIERFSEDIDLSLDHKPSESEKRKINEQIIEIGQNLNMTLFNFESIKSRYNYNKYIFKYNSLFISHMQEIIIETNFYQPVYPIHIITIHSFIGDFLNVNNIDKPYFLNLPVFKMNVQTLERTFVDKVFAICDYYLENMAERDSRHLYDIYKILPLIKFDNKLLELIHKVRIDRSLSKNNPAAHDGINPQNILEKIKSEKFYESDYNVITVKLLYEEITYNQCIKDGLDKIIISNFWNSVNKE